jgi:hypothetical protein
MGFMSDSTIPAYTHGRRWRFEWALPVLFTPRRAFAQIVAADGAVWQTPILILLLTGLVRTLVAGGLRAAAAASGEIPLPAGWEWYTPEQQAQFMQAMSATSGPVFTYVLPAVMTLLAVYLGWLIVGWVLHLVLTLMGGRQSSEQALNIVAWALLPFAIRDVVRVVAMWNSGQLLTGLGLSGFAPPLDNNWAVYLAALLVYVDIYLIWHIGLLLTGVSRGDSLGRGKVWTAVLITIIGLYALSALPALLAAQFEGLTVIRPFF